MRLFLAIAIFLIPGFLGAQPDGESVATLIRNLSSANFQLRLAAVKALKDRPEAVPALRDALRSKDAEVARRAAEVLDYLDRAPLRELKEAVKGGLVEKAIKLLANLPAGKYEAEAWQESRELFRTLDGLHRKNGGKVNGAEELWAGAPVFVTQERITEEIQAPSRGIFFLRAAAVDLDFSRLKRTEAGEAILTSDFYVVAAGPVRLAGFGLGVVTVFAGGSVEASSAGVHDFLIVSAGDVTITYGMSNSVVIARGNITLQDGKIWRSRLIAGKSVIANKKRVRECIVTENEPNPLGFIRWSDAPKEKAAPKAK